MLFYGGLKMAKRIKVGQPKVNEFKVQFDLKIPRKLKKFFIDEKFWVRYDDSIEEVPSGILIIPAVMTLAPIAWANGTSIKVKEIDSEFLESLIKVKEAYKEKYPSVFKKKAKPIIYDQKKKYSPKKEEKTNSSMLFSLGVDSLTCYLKHIDEFPALFTIHGSDLNIENEQGWKNVLKNVNSFAVQEGVSVHTIQSNFRSILNYLFLDKKFMKEIDRGWWGAIHYGTGLPALCGPISFKENYDVIYQGSGYTQDETYPTAQPSFVNKLKWNKTRVEITEVEMTRHEKIKYLIKNWDDINASTPIRSCYSDYLGRNCSKCEKCYRTIISLSIEGSDPNKFGYDVNQSSLTRIKEDFERGKINLKGIDVVIDSSKQSNRMEYYGLELNKNKSSQIYDNGNAQLILLNR